MVTLLCVNANDNNLNPEFVDFLENYPELIDRLKDEKLFLACRMTDPGDPEDSRRRAANFLWFLRFELTYQDREEQNDYIPPTLTVIEGGYFDDNT